MTTSEASRAMDLDVGVSEVSGCRASAGVLVLADAQNDFAEHVPRTDAFMSASRIREGILRGDGHFEVTRLDCLFEPLELGRLWLRDRVVAHDGDAIARLRIGRDS